MQNPQNVIKGSVCFCGRYSTGKCRGCRKEPEIRESKMGGRKKGGLQINVQKVLLN